MARIRSIKTEFWTAEQVMECSPIARLLFIGMWNFCDDGGNHPATINEYFLAGACMLPFLVVGAAAIYLLVFRDPCEEAGE